MTDSNLINLKENVSHGDFMLPFTIYNGNLSNVYEDIPIHWHEEMEVLLVEDGTGQFMIDLIPYKLEKGDIIFIHPHTLHSGTHIKGNNMKWSSMVFNLSMLKPYSTDSTLIKYLAPIINKEHTLPTLVKHNFVVNSELILLIKSIFVCFNEKDDGYELELKSLLYLFISKLYSTNLIDKSTNSNKLTETTVEKIKLTLNYIHNNYNNELTIYKLASICGFSEYYFMRFFKKHIGLTCVQYLNGYRLEKACYFLINTDMSVMDVSLEVGFESLSYFIKLFKRKYNLTPLEFKKIKKIELCCYSN